MRIREYLETAKKMLKGTSNSAEIDAELILAHVLQKPRVFLIAHPEFLLSLGEQQECGILLQKRLSGVPLAYLTGSAEFYGLSFFVNDSVLVPRPETEQIVAIACKLLTNGGTIIDVGTGSGCILISVMKNAHPARAFGIDISASALDVARQNADFHRVAPEFIESDLLANLPDLTGLPHPIVITANLPYVPEKERHPSILKEPEIALFSGSDGMNHYRRLFRELQITNYELQMERQETHDSRFMIQDLRKETDGKKAEDRSFDVCLFEFHPPQEAIFRQLFAEYFPQGRWWFLPDLSGLPRTGILIRDNGLMHDGLPFSAVVAQWQRTHL